MAGTEHERANPMANPVSPKILVRMVFLITTAHMVNAKLVP
jgi:hypothetical protein